MSEEQRIRTHYTCIILAFVPGSDYHTLLRVRRLSTGKNEPVSGIFIPAHL